MTAILLLIRTLLGGIFSAANIRKWFGFLVTHWKEVVSSLIIGLFLYQAFSPVQFLFGLGTVPAQKEKVVALQHQVTVLNQQLDTCKATNVGLASAITDQNNHIKGWGDLSNKIEASTATLMKEITKSRAVSQSQVNSILNAPTPKTCDEAMTFMRDAVKSGELQWARPKQP